MKPHRPGSNGRLSITLRVGDTAKIALPSGREILIACDGAMDSEACFVLTAWATCVLRALDAPPVLFETYSRHVRIRLLARVSLAETEHSDGAEIYVSTVEQDRVTVSIDAPREWRISRVMRDAA